MFSAGINERGDSATLNDIHASALKREPLIREIADWKSKFDLALEPSSYGPRIIGIQVCYFAGQQRAQVSINNHRCESGLIVLLSVEPRDDPPYDKCDKDESGDS